MNAEKFTKDMKTAKIEISACVQGLAHMGISNEIIAAALGSSAGNFLGMVMQTDDARLIGEMVDKMRQPMINDAQKAFRYLREATK